MVVVHGEFFIGNPRAGVLTASFTCVREVAALNNTGLLLELCNGAVLLGGAVLSLSARRKLRGLLGDAVRPIIRFNPSLYPFVRRGDAVTLWTLAGNPQAK